MKTFTIDTDNNIGAFATQGEAGFTGVPVDTFSSQKELAQLAGTWPAERLVAIWNSLPGVTPVKGLQRAKVGASRIWERIQGLGEPEKPKAERQAKAGAPAPQGAPAKPKSKKKTTSAKNAPQAKKVAEAEPGAGPREGSKTARVVAMLQRKNGATLAEIMTTMGWQKHTVRGFMAGAMKKAGHAVESFQSDQGERTYRIHRSIEPPPGPARRRRGGLSSSPRGVVRIALQGAPALPADQTN